MLRIHQQRHLIPNILVAWQAAALPTLRLALTTLEGCVDWLLAGCNYGGPPDIAALRSAEGVCRAEWLISTTLFLHAHLKP